MKRPLIVLLILNIVCIFLVDRTTFKYSSGNSISGNGNPGIIALVMGLFLFAILLYYVGRVTWNLNNSNRNTHLNIILTLTSTFIFTIMMIGEISKVHTLSKNLNGFTNEKDSIVYRFGWINQYTNNLFLIGIFFFLVWH
ncbi:hypothetical protein ACFRAM_02785 [Paenibacillus sp. NPDC056722]|uniref:hypothetical protein n=1 Tax=Paenibacillus sp. NPDC056722 TaxID=3345924 RepID=UPI00367BE3B3